MVQWGFLAMFADYGAQEMFRKLREIVMVRCLVLVLVNAGTSRGPRKVEDEIQFQAWSRLKNERTGQVSRTTAEAY